MMAWREGDDVRLYTRRGHDWSERYPAVVAALRTLKVGSCLIDGELVVCDEAGVSSFERLRSRQLACSSRLRFRPLACFFSSSPA
jgi:bifunctional non-homologous end joining protein LigD